MYSDRVRHSRLTFGFLLLVVPVLAGAQEPAWVQEPEGEPWNYLNTGHPEFRFGNFMNPETGTRVRIPARSVYYHVAAWHREIGNESWSDANDPYAAGPLPLRSRDWHTFVRDFVVFERI